MQRVPHIVINLEVVILELDKPNLSVVVPKDMKNRDFYATLNARTRVIGVNTNTTEFSIGANPRVELASRRDSTIVGNVQKVGTIRLVSAMKNAQKDTATMVCSATNRDNFLRIQ